MGEWKGAMLLRERGTIAFETFAQRYGLGPLRVWNGRKGGRESLSLALSAHAYGINGESGHWKNENGEGEGGIEGDKESTSDGKGGRWKRACPLNGQEKALLKDGEGEGIVLSLFRREREKRTCVRNEDPTSEMNKEERGKKWFLSKEMGEKTNNYLSIKGDSIDKTRDFCRIGHYDSQNESGPFLSF